MKKKNRADNWANLRVLIQNYANASIDESWKGGGDPASIPVLEARLNLARAELDTFLDFLKRISQEEK